MVTFDDVVGMQAQNERLLREHHAMSSKVSELEGRVEEDPATIEAARLREEVAGLREEREKQSKLVAGIVHQRDLYRALVARNDADGAADGEGQLALADERARDLPEIEARNRVLAEESSRLRADAGALTHERDALQGRLQKLDAHAADLTAANERARGELATARATAARCEVDIRHYQGRVERLEATVDGLREERAGEAGRREQAEELLTRTQGHLDAVRGELARKEQQCQQAASKMRLVEVQLQTSASNEKRMQSEADSLRSEVAGQETLLTSVQRIEASLAAKSETQVESLQDEVKRLREEKADGDARHETSVARLEGRVAELEVSAKDLAGQKEKATVNATKEALGGLRVHRQDERDAAVGGERTSSRSRRRGEGAEQNRGCCNDC
mmetsp:Transcript_33464/g.80035  ORF Transcript_33464/g.80035 Transcript_33464/m.80035 type:complete len:390 (+) Transcript_33464:381-1550(+)